MSRILALLVISSLSIAANAIPLPRVPRALVHIPATLTTDYDFEGIIALGNCSASLIRFEQAKDTDLAIVMTNGHCLESGFPSPGEFITRQPSSRRLRLMDARANVVATLRATEILYATMTTTDLAIYKTGETYGDILRKYNVRPLILSSERPQVGLPIQVVSGYWERGYSCNVDGFAYRLKEDVYTWNDSIRYSNPGCEVIGGTSGSPVIATGTRIAIGVNNTGNENGGRCSANNPCEVDQNGNIKYEQGLSYAQQTHQVYSCLNQNNELDLTLANCQLPH